MKRQLIFAVFGFIQLIMGVVCVCVVGVCIFLFGILKGDDLWLLFLLIQFLITGFCFSIGGRGLIKKAFWTRSFYLYVLLPFYLVSVWALFLLISRWDKSIFLGLRDFLWPFWWMAFPAFVLIFFNLKIVRKELR